MSESDVPKKSQDAPKEGAKPPAEKKTSGSLAQLDAIAIREQAARGGDNNMPTESRRDAKGRKATDKGATAPDGSRGAAPADTPVSKRVEDKTRQAQVGGDAGGTGGGLGVADGDARRPNQAPAVEGQRNGHTLRKIDQIAQREAAARGHAPGLEGSTTAGEKASPTESRDRRPVPGLDAKPGGPPVDFTFDRFAPEQRAAALKNQERLKELRREFPEFDRMNELVERSVLGADKHGNLTLGERRESLNEKASNFVADQLAEKLLEVTADGLVEGGGAAVKPALDLAGVMGDIKQEKLLNYANCSKEAELWRQQKIVGLIADRLAPEGVRDKPLGTFKTVESERERLVEGYWSTEHALATHLRYMRGDSRTRRGPRQTTIGPD